ncbi:MAG TPA: hypothetical protein PKM25_07335 [Candidatus Ozemobacteraceae bacterium]|nr:hypothetical protein [Candidatus Ozemobacteraceae bacterium]
MTHIDTTHPSAAIRTTSTRNAAGALICGSDLFEKDLYRNQMPQLRGEELQLAAPRSPSATATVATTTPAAKKQRNSTARP